MRERRKGGGAGRTEGGKQAARPSSLTNHRLTHPMGVLPRGRSCRFHVRRQLGPSAKKRREVPGVASGEENAVYKRTRWMRKRKEKGRGGRRTKRRKMRKERKTNSGKSFLFKVNVIFRFLRVFFVLVFLVYLLTPCS